MTWLSVDPGRHTGLVAWEGDRPVAWKQVDSPSKMDFVDWLPYIVGNVKAFALMHQADAVAIEQPFIDPGRPATQLNALVASLRTLGRRQSWATKVYPQSTVKARIRPQGSAGMDDKEMLRLAVRMVYGEDTRDLPQDIIDAIACGHCHLAVTGEANILKEKVINV